jgi:hypothetical protein
MALSRKSGKSRTRRRKPRSTRTKAERNVAQPADPQASLIKELKAHARDLEKTLKARARDLAEARDQQTATADVLKVISRSAFELQPVFDTVVENAVRLCEAERAFLFQFDGELLRYAASYNVSPELREFVNRNPIAPGRHSISARAALDRRTVHVRDVHPIQSMPMRCEMSGRFGRCSRFRC